MHVSFQYANFGTRRDGADPRCEVAGYQLRMTYELYQYFLPARDWSEEVYMQTITKLITLTSLRDNAKKVRVNPQIELQVPQNLTVVYTSIFEENMVESHRKHHSY